MKRRILASLLVVGTLLPGCSFMFTRPPPPEPYWPRAQYARCTATRVWPAIDGLVAVSWAVSAVNVALANNDGFVGESDVFGTSVVGSVLMAGLWGASSWVGFDRAARCDAFRAYVAQRRFGRSGFERRGQWPPPRMPEAQVTPGRAPPPVPQRAPPGDQGEHPPPAGMDAPQPQPPGR